MNWGEVIGLNNGKNSESLIENETANLSWLQDFPFLRTQP